MEFGEWEGGEDLGGVNGSETMISLYCIKFISIKTIFLKCVWHILLFSTSLLTQDMPMGCWILSISTLPPKLLSETLGFGCGEGRWGRDDSSVKWFRGLLMTLLPG